jgi:hypothetical protein
MFLDAAAQIIPVLYLAVAFQAFGSARNREGHGSFFDSGIQWPPAKRRCGLWKTAILVWGVQLAAIGGEALALLGVAAPVVAGAMAFIALVLVERQAIWAFRLVGGGWLDSHGVLAANCLFWTPIGLGAITWVLVAAL